MDPIEATDTASKIAGDSPVLWALVVAVISLVSAIVVLWKAYQGRQAKIDDIAMKNVEVITAFTAKIEAMSATIERVQNSCNSVWSNIGRRGSQSE